MLKKSLLFFSFVFFLASCSHVRPEAQQPSQPPKALYFCDFGEGKWNADEWQLVRSPRWEESSHWVQCADHIENYVSSDLCVTDSKKMQDHWGELYVSMLLKQPFQGNRKFTLECAFVDSMAPLLVIAPELPEVYGEHLEVVVYDKGINLWHHYFQDGKPSWRKLGYLNLNLEKGRKYSLSAQLQFTSRGVMMVMGCEGNTFGCLLDTDWPKDYYVGFTGCEGLNQFYSFRAE